MRSLIRSNKSLGYNRKTDGFLQLVPETYNDDELVEWTRAPPPVSQPDEPGNLGKCLKTKTK